MDDNNSAAWAAWILGLIAIMTIEFFALLFVGHHFGLALEIVLIPVCVVIGWIYAGARP